MKKKTLISITSLSVIIALPITIISCSNNSDNSNIVSNNDLIEITLKNDKNQNFIFAKIEESNKIWDNVLEKILNEIKKNENKIKVLNKYYFKKYSPAFAKYFSHLETIASKLNSNGEISQKINNLKNKSNEIDYQDQIDEIIKELKTFKTQILDFFGDSYKNLIANSTKWSEIELFKKFDLEKALSFTFGHSEFSYMYRTISDTQSNSTKKVQDSLKQLKLGYILKRPIEPNDQPPFHWDPNENRLLENQDEKSIYEYYEKNENKYFNEYFKEPGIFAGKIIEAEIIQKIRMLSILKTFNLDLSNERVKPSFLKSNRFVVGKIANSLIDNEIIEFAKNMHPTFKSFKPHFLLQKLKDEFKELLPEFYKENKSHFELFENSIKKIEKVFIGEGIKSSDVTKKGLVFIIELIQKTLKSIPIKEIETIAEFNELNMKVNDVWELVKKTTSIFSSFEKELNIVKGFTTFLNEAIVGKINELRDKSLNSEIKPYEDFINFWENMERANGDYFRKLNDQERNLGKWLTKFISLSTFVDSYALQLAIDNFDNIEKEDLIFERNDEEELA